MVDSSNFPQTYNYLGKQVLINYLHRLIVWVVPEEFRPDFQQKRRNEEAEDAFNMLALRESKSCRQRTLSVIKEECESCDEF